MNNYGPVGMNAQGTSAGRPQWAGDKIPSGYKTAQLQQFTPEQMQLYQQGFKHLAPDSYLSRLAGGDESFFNEMEAPAKREFQGILGEAGSRFSGLGMGARKGSGFNQHAGQLVSNFAQDLASKRMELRRQAIKDLMGMSNELLNQRPYERSLVQKEQNPWYGIAGQFAGAIPGALASYATGGGAAGAQQAFRGASSIFGGPQGSYSSPGGGTTFYG